MIIKVTHEIALNKGNGQYCDTIGKTRIIAGVGNWFYPKEGTKVTLVTLSGLAELKQHSIDASGITLGSALTLNEFKVTLDKVINEQPGR